MKYLNKVRDAHLGQHASIVHCPYFENGAMKVMRGHGRLTSEEKKALHMFEIGATSGISSTSAVVEATSIEEETNAERWVRMAQESTTSKSSYRSVEHLCPSSVICETLFSDAKHIMSDVRSNMDPSTLEMILILKNNMDLWDARTIDMIINRDDAAVAGQKRGRDNDNASSSVYQTPM